MDLNDRRGIRMTTRMNKVLLITLFCISSTLSQKSAYLEQIKNAAEQGWRDNPRIIEQWKRDYKPSTLWGYNSPGYPVYLAGTMGFLYEITKDETYARRTAELNSGDLEFLLHAALHTRISQNTEQWRSDRSVPSNH
jgi:hypothetical protein